MSFHEVYTNTRFWCQRSSGFLRTSIFLCENPYDTLEKRKKINVELFKGLLQSGRGRLKVPERFSLAQFDNVIIPRRLLCELLENRCQFVKKLNIFACELDGD